MTIRKKVVTKIRARKDALLQTFPDVVRSYWQQTMGIHVQDTRPTRCPRWTRRKKKKTASACNVGADRLLRRNRYPLCGLGTRSCRERLGSDGLLAASDVGRELLDIDFLVLDNAPHHVAD